MEPIFTWGINLILAFQNLGDWLLTPMQSITFLGNELFFLLLLPILYWCVDTGLGVRVGVILMVTGVANNFLKMVLHMPRPYWIDTRVNAGTAEASFGAPSGHALIATGVWGTMAAWSKKWWAWLLAILVIFLIGISRLYLGVHFPHDVLLGWLAGAVVLALTLILWDPVSSWIKKMGTAWQILLALVFSLLLILPSLAVYLPLQQSFTIPAVWSENAALAFEGGDPIFPVSIAGAVTNAASFFGLAVGLALISARGSFSAGGIWWKRVLRFLIGMIGVALLYLGLKLAFPDGETWLALILRFVRYGLLGLWVAAGAPLLFRELKLADRAVE